MKFLVVFIHEQDSEKTANALVEAGLRFTMLNSTSGLLRQSTRTFLLGLEEAKVKECLDIFRQNSEAREVGAPASILAGIEVRPEEFGGTERGPITVTVGGAVGFMWDAERVLKD